jgi:Protein of unknown function (DUF2726)
MEFYHRLKRALPALHVFPQISFAAVLTDDGRLSGKSRWLVRAKFDRKIADFVICDFDFNVLALPQVLVTLQRHAKAYGYFAPERFIGRTQEESDEIRTKVSNNRSKRGCPRH